MGVVIQFPVKEIVPEYCENCTHWVDYSGDTQPTKAWCQESEDFTLAHGSCNNFKSVKQWNTIFGSNS